MAFVYLHVLVFAIWMLLVERTPWPTLTLIVSLEAIFLSTFVMISQNRADARRQVQANETWKNVQKIMARQDEILQELRRNDSQGQVVPVVGPQGDKDPVPHAQTDEADRA